MERFVLYAYFWHLEPASNYDRTIIRVYGVTEEGENVCVIVDDFTPYAYLELPAGKKYPWDANPQMATAVIKRLESICGNFKPLSMSYKKKHKLYGAHFNPDGSRMTFPYIFCKFKNIKHRSMMEFKIRGSIHVNGIGSLTLRMHEQTATPILQMTTSLELKKAGWIQLMGQRVGADACITTCHHEFRVSWFNMKPYEYNKPAKILGMAFDIEAYSRNSARMPNPEEDADVVFQISCILRREGEKEDKWRRYLLTLGEPDSTIPDNIVVYSYNNEGDLLIGFAELVRDENPNYIAGYNIFGFDINYLYKRAIHTHEIANFSQLGFIEGKQCTLEHLDGLASKMNSRRGDLVYIYAEGRIFIDLYPIAMAQTKLNSYTLNSVAQHYLTDKYQKDPLDHIGIFKCYRVGMRKDENGEYTSKAKRAISICGKYCVKDTELVVMLLDRMRTWYGLVEMAILCNIPIFEVFTEGQQLRIYSQLYAECMRRNYVVEKEGYIPEKGERYRGAYVVDPNPGYYDEVACLDFKSLYPSIMIAHNLCYTTMVMETPVADDDCTVLEWHDHTLCEHDPKIIELDRLKKEIGDIVEQQRKLRKQRDALRISDFDSGLSSNKQLAKKAHAKAVEELNAEIHKLDIQAKPLRERKQSVNVTPKERSTKQMCAHRKYKFVKSSKAKGIVPELLQNILDARARTRKEQKSVGKRVEELKSLMGGGEELNDMEQYWGILEARQLAYKICANSVYGGLGVNDSSSRKFVPLMPVAMCVTYLGREHIQLAAREAQETYGANLVYGDTDSIMVNFPMCKTPHEVWDRSDFVAAELTKLYAEPLELEFENIYKQFLIFSKKRYCYRKADRDGVIDLKLGSKGILLARRDNSNFVRTIYKDVLNKFMCHENRNDILYYVTCQLKKLLSRGFSYDEFVITMSVKGMGDIDETDVANTSMIGGYKMRTLLSSDSEDRKAAMDKKGVSTAEEFYIKQLPRQAQLAERMRQRGCPPEPGSRLQFVVTDALGKTTQGERIEEFKYFQDHASVLKIDYLYYLEALVTPVDEALNAMYGSDSGFTQNMIAQYLARTKNYKKLMKELESFWKPKIVREKAKKVNRTR